MSREFFNKGNQLYNSDLYDEALKMYHDAVAADITFYDAHFCVAKTLLRLKKGNEGVAHFKKYAGLIPSEKLQDYLLGFVNILQQENFVVEAISLLKSFNIPLSESLNKKYLELLLIAKNKAAFYKHFFKTINAETHTKIFKELLVLNTIPLNIKEEITQENIFGKQLLNAKRIEALEKNTFSNQNIYSNVKNIKTKNDAINSGQTDDIPKVLKEIDQDYAAALESVFAIHKAFENDPRVLHKIQTFLVNNNFDKQKISEIEEKIDNFNSEQKSKNIRKILIFAGVVAFFIVSFFVFDYFSTKSKALEYALFQNDLTVLNDYLDHYGNNDKVHEKRELILYQNAIKYNSSKSILGFVEAYPKSKFLRQIKVKNNNNTPIKLFGAETNNTFIEPNTNGVFLLPYGCIVGLKGVLNNVNSNIKYIKISKNLTITNDEFIERNPLENEQLYYTNATMLNLREYENENSRILYQIPRGEPVQYLGKKSQYQSNANFYGEDIMDFYYFVQATTSQTGWIHGAGINNLKVDYKLSLADFKLDQTQIKKQSNDSSGIIVEYQIKPKEIVKENLDLEEQKSASDDLETNQETYLQEETKPTKNEEAKVVKSTCQTCSGKGKTSKKCTADGCQNGFISATCSTCNGNYRSGKGICPNPGCNYVGCEYCDYDGAACTKCSRGKTTIKHSLCSGTGNVSVQCSSCAGKGYINK